MMTDPIVEAPVISNEAPTSEVSQVVEAPEPGFLDPETFYSKMPDAFRGTLDDVFADYNGRHKTALSEATSKYSGFDEVIANRSPEQLAMAARVFDMINQGPDSARQVYDELGRAYSFAQAAQQTQQVQQTSQQQVTDQEDEDLLTPEQKEIRELRKTVEDLVGKSKTDEERYNQQLQQEYNVQYQQDLDGALKNVFTADPGLEKDQARMGDLLNRISYIDQADRASGKPRPFAQVVAQAHSDQKAYNQHLYGIFGQQGQTSSSNPIVMSPSGGTPAPNMNYSEMSSQQLKDATVQRLTELMNS